MIFRRTYILNKNNGLKLCKYRTRNVQDTLTKLLNMIDVVIMNSLKINSQFRCKKKKQTKNKLFLHENVFVDMIYDAVHG